MSYDWIVVGTGFASSFFLHGLLRKLPSHARILVLEKGRPYPLEEQLAARSALPPNVAKGLDETQSEVPWAFSTAFGGSSNCWWACTPRMLPNDFRLKSLYGRGRDWPVGYDDLEEYYCEAEEIMQISGDDNTDLFPRSRPFPQPPHRLSDVDKVFQRTHPGLFFAQPTARARLATDTRPACCASGICEVCPISAKFTVAGDMSDLYADPRLEIRFGAEVLELDMVGGQVGGVVVVANGREERVAGNAIALGTNSFFNAAILSRSNDRHPLLGRRLHEQRAMVYEILIEGVENFNGSTSITGQGYSFYDGDHRREAAAGLIESWNFPFLRAEPGKHRMTIRLKLILETLPDHENRVLIDPENPSLPKVIYKVQPDYLNAALTRFEDALPDYLRGFEVTKITRWDTWNETESHNLGTVVMGVDPSESVVNDRLQHHAHGNLWVLGGSSFPTGAPANPTLTISALSLRAANLI
ncbi:MAG: GMC family oxidoreductase [Pseudomonadota bacterium]